MGNEAFFFQGDSLLLPQEESGSPCREIPLSYADKFPLSDIFTIPAIDGSALNDKGTISCVYVPKETVLPPGWQSVPVRQILTLLPDSAVTGTGHASGILRALHIAKWRRDSRFCGSCGAANTDAPDELARLCPVCGRLEYPRIAPAVIVIIVNDEGKVLLAHNKKFIPCVYSLIAGFNEAGESLESTVAREIREEVDIEVRDIRYVISQPWPFPNSLMLGFSARYASGTIRPDGIEIEDAQWFSRENLPAIPNPGSVSRYLIDYWLDTTESIDRNQNDD